MEVAGKTDIGRVRTNNEDCFGYDAALGIFILCDGMGGETAGEVASELGVSSVLSFFRQAAGQDEYPASESSAAVSSEAKALGKALQAANRAIRQASAADSEKSGMGTTIVAALVRGDHLAIAHVGDSRLYRLHGNTIEQLTNDHSLVMEQVRHGLLTPEQAAQSPLQNIITRALGVGDTVEVELADWELAAGDTLLLCSDGLNRHLSDERILSIVAESSSLATACKELIASANEAGGSDNITCLLVRVG